MTTSRRMGLWWAACALALLSVVVGVVQSRVAREARTDRAPRGLLSLQLPMTRTDAAAMVRSLECGPVTAASPSGRGCKAAFAGLSWDFVFIASYTLAWCAFAIWGGLVCGVRNSVRLAVPAVLVLAGLSDMIENVLLAAQLYSLRELSLPWSFPAFGEWLAALAASGGRLSAWTLDHVVALTRAFAMTKFVLLSAGVLGAVALAGGGWLRLKREADVRSEPAAASRDGKVETESPSNTFASLMKLETEDILPKAQSSVRRPDQPKAALAPVPGEPFVEFRAADVIGLALSGGGIRSATFNLGLMQGLRRLDLLRLFDYLSTVSGGGYIGSFWSAWLARQPNPPRGAFPIGSSAVDSDVERHVREFSRFLAPRFGFFEVETWTGLVAIFAGLVPALLLATSVLGVAIVAWLGLTFPMASPTLPGPAMTLAFLTLAILGVFDAREQSKRPVTTLSPTYDTKDEERRGLVYWRTTLTVTIVVLLAHVGLTLLYARGEHGALPVFEGGWQPALGESGFARWWHITGIQHDSAAWFFSPRLFDPVLVWLATSLILVAVRLIVAVRPQAWERGTLVAFDRVLMRVLAAAAVWAAVAAIWHITLNLGRFAAELAAAVLAAGGLFAALRNWIGVALRRPAEAGLLDRLKPYLPQVLAYVTIVLSAALAGHLLIVLGGTDWLRWWLVATSLGFVMTLALFIDPGHFGLHNFYRERISRAYAGASNLGQNSQVGAKDNRSTDPIESDDLLLKNLQPQPLHLICCAANDLTGDPVETLGRGARSAVLSRHGFALGDFFRPLPETMLGSAVTASAAAFNSNMGQVSLQVGPAVSFLMTALNLRLGLWLRHPLAQQEQARRWPGLLLYREMLGLTVASGPTPKSASDLTPTLRDVHLSDGGHFENLALYELVRRHCRYILVSDCAADPEIAFDDLGNAIRRIREDFGVDIQIDVSPLKPQAGVSRQHVALGSICYSETDRGVLLYVKPTITGDEPPDVLQYKARNGSFPHEGTTDQFYDEAQWESYRRLGQHAAECIFDFVTVTATDDRARTADWVFGSAVHRWGETPEGLVDRVLEMTGRFNDFEADLRQSPTWHSILHEVFPELPSPSVAAARQELDCIVRDQPRPPAPAVRADATAADLMVIVRATQVMEDVWMACELDKWWSHPLNLGWVNLFARWATAPSFRHWWPIFSPMFSPGFRRFLEFRFALVNPRSSENEFVPPQSGEIRELTPGGPTPGLSERWWTERSRQHPKWDGKRALQNIIALPNPSGAPTEMQAGIVTIAQSKVADKPVVAGWTSDDFFVPPSLWGASIGWYFLKGLLKKLANEGVAECYVIVKAPVGEARNHVSLHDRLSFIEQYRKIGFRERRSDEDTWKAEVSDALTRLGLGDLAEGDTVWQLLLRPEK